MAMEEDLMEHAPQALLSLSILWTAAKKGWVYNLHPPLPLWPLLAKALRRRAAGRTPDGRQQRPQKAAACCGC